MLLPTMSAPAPPVKKDGSSGGDLEEGNCGTTTASTTRSRVVVWKLLSASFFAALLLWAADTSVARPPQLQLGYYLGYYSAYTSSPATPSMSKNSSSIVVVREKPIFWMSVPIAPNFTATLLSRWMAPAGDSRTADISIPALDGRASPVRLSAAEIHEFSFTALDAAGRPRSLGGDYFEVDLSGPSWKSRPPLLDRGDGSYSLRLQVAPDFAGAFNLTVTLLFRSFEGLKMSTARLKYGRQLRNIPIIISRPEDLRTGDGSAPSPPALRTCGGSDFGQDFRWAGRWTRHGGREGKGECGVDEEGRYRCLAADHPCEGPWCVGPLGALESDGWVYSAHCSFKIFGGGDAWDCLANKWIFFWGDSNHVDTIRNLLHFVLGRADVEQVPRRFDRSFTNPRNASQSVRITSIFNGHWNESMNYLGLQSLENEGFRRLLGKYFSAEEEERAPDVMILNSGLHDGVYWRSVRAFAGGAERAAEFWAEVVRGARERGKAAPRVLYRTTIAVGGYAREMAFNPSKMEAFDGVLLEKLREKGLLSGGGVVDDFDMTFPWHYDNRCSDGVHYGRAPAKKVWRDGQIGHHYFVDLMLGHVLLNAICSSH